MAKVASVPQARAMMRTSAANIALAAIIGVIGGQALGRALLLMDSAFGWASILTALLARSVETAGAITGICLVGFLFKVVGFGAVRAAGGVGLAGAVLCVVLSFIIETRYGGATEPLAFLFIRPLLLFAILAAAGVIAALAATAVAAMLKAICSADAPPPDAKRRIAVLFIIAASSLLISEGATWSFSPNRTTLLSDVLNLAYVLIGVGALGAWLRVLSARIIGLAALLTVLASLLLTAMSLVIVAANDQAFNTNAGLSRLLTHRAIHAAAGALAAGVAVALIARGQRFRAVAQEPPPDDRV